MHFTAKVVTQRFQFEGNVITLTLIKSHWSNVILMMSLWESQWIKTHYLPCEFIFFTVDCSFLWPVESVPAYTAKKRINLGLMDLLFQWGISGHQASECKDHHSWDSRSYINPPKFIKMPLFTLNQSDICLATPLLFDCSPVTSNFPPKNSHMPLWRDVWYLLKINFLKSR